MIDPSNEVTIINEYRKRIRHNYSPKVYNNTNRLIDFLNMPKWFFDNIKIESIENIRKVADKQLFYVSNHLSMADFLIQGYTFWKKELPIPRFIAGENLNKFPFGIFWKKCGAYYLDRDSVKNPEYMVVYDEEIKNGLRNKENLMVYAEGGRNYSGNGLMKFQSGTIGQVLDIVKEGQDIWLVPCFINYDKRIEENVLDQVKKYKINLKKLKENTKNFKKQDKKFRLFVEDLRFKRKNKFHFSWDVWAYVQRVFDANKGNAYLNFGDAFSIKDFLADVDNQDAGKRKKIVLTEKVSYEIKQLANRHGPI